jgi:hypothetical protein
MSARWNRFTPSSLSATGRRTSWRTRLGAWPPSATPGRVARLGTVDPWEASALGTWPRLPGRGF